VEVLGAIGGLLGVVFGTPAIVLWLLNRKNANRALTVQEKTLNVTEFEAQTAAYKDLLDRANAALNDANTKLASSVKELAQYQEERQELLRKVDIMGEEIERLKKADATKGDELIETNHKLEKLRTLMLAYVKRTGIPLTTEEQAIFDETVPTDIVRRIRLNQEPMGT
jgi:chromosome segregation ATPase